MRYLSEEKKVDKKVSFFEKSAIDALKAKITGGNPLAPEEQDLMQVMVDMYQSKQQRTVNSLLDKLGSGMELTPKEKKMLDMAMSDAAVSDPEPMTTPPEPDELEEPDLTAEPIEDDFVTLEDTLLIPGTNFLLEKGDRIRIIPEEEWNDDMMDEMDMDYDEEEDEDEYMERSH